MADRRLLGCAGWVVGYVVLVTAIVLGLLETRQRVLATMSGADSRDEWQQWRDAASDAEGPVRRAVPKGSEPPGLVMMRDHFAIIAVAAVVLSSVLYGFIALVVGGMLRNRETPAPQPSVRD